MTDDEKSLLATDMDALKKIRAVLIMAREGFEMIAGERERLESLPGNIDIARACINAINSICGGRDDK